MLKSTVPVELSMAFVPAMCHTEVLKFKQEAHLCTMCCRHGRHDKSATLKLCESVLIRVEDSHCASRHFTDEHRLP